jgi:hypothetical protein
MTKYQYTELKEQMNYNLGSWVWLLDDEIINPYHVAGTGFKYYDHLSMVQAVNVNRLTDSIQSYSILLMREI